ncbi:Tigger transposable elementderived protein 6 [Phytophthora palmivora]|uniref:Tigger transposable elementderived protein 6 n=1 Tax=Phytophthora palmivora TaxID=4796 RepID=A0A2P4XS16_9STRA|nr:Tigger transposable elementderived protein 6 [Phytophthora palmivora]
MTTSIYQLWLQELDSSMRAEDRHVLLLVDNASSHTEEGLTLTNVRVEKLPPNTTSKLQPLDQGIIYCVKRSVLNKKMIRALEVIDDGTDDNPYKSKHAPSGLY